MKRFHFRLERLERLRRHEQTRSALALADARAAAEACVRIRLIWERAHDDACERWCDATRNHTLDAGSVREIAEQIDGTRRAIERAREREDEALDALATRRRDCLEKSRACRVLEKLREKRRRRWLADVQREEQRALDELHLLQRDNRDGLPAPEGTT